MPWILTVSPRSLAAGGVEVTEPRDGGAGRPLDRRRDGVPRGPGGDAGLTGRPGRRRADGRRAGPRRRPLRPARGRRRRVARGDRARLAGAAQAPPPRRRRRRRRRARPREADQRRPRLAERPGPPRPLRRASASASAPIPPAARATGVRHGRPPRAWPPQPAPRPHARRAPGGPRARTSSAATRRERLARFLDRVARLTPDELDRLAAAEPPPIAFLATVRRFVTPDARGRVRGRRGARSRRRVPHERWAEVGLREGLLGVAAELVLSPFLDDTARGAVPRPGARPAAACVGGLDRPAALRAQRRRGGRRPRPGRDA